MDAGKIMEINKQDCEKYVVFWENFAKNTKDGLWRKPQNFFINSLMHGAKQRKISARDYLTIKKRAYQARNW